VQQNILQIFGLNTATKYEKLRKAITAKLCTVKMLNLRQVFLHKCQKTCVGIYRNGSNPV